MILCQFSALLAFSPIQAQPVPSLDVATNREYYHAESHNKVYLEMRVGTTETALTAPPATQLISLLSSTTRDRWPAH